MANPKKEIWRFLNASNQESVKRGVGSCARNSNKYRDETFKNGLIRIDFFRRKPSLAQIKMTVLP
jgi:hypothetical protein